jgi:hypothetical protein
MSYALTENERHVIIALGRKPRMTAYRLKTADKALDLQSSTVRFLVRELEERNLIRCAVEEKWRTGFTRKEFELTFLGCVFFFAEMEREKNRNTKIEVDLAENYGRTCEYPPFEEYEKIDKALRGKAHEVFGSVARWLLEGPDGPPRCVWNAVTLKHPLVKRLGKSWPETRDREAVADQKRKQEELWKNEFAAVLFERLKPRAIWGSPKLNSFYKTLFRERKEVITQELERIEELLRKNGTIDSRIRSMEKPEWYGEPRVQRKVPDSA